MTNPERNPYGVLIGELPYSELDADLRDRLGPEDDTPIDGMRDPRFPGSYLTPTGPGEPGPGIDCVSWEADIGQMVNEANRAFPGQGVNPMGGQFNGDGAVTPISDDALRPPICSPRYASATNGGAPIGGSP